MLFPKVLNYIKEAEGQFGTIPEARKQVLLKISQYVEHKIKAGEKAELIYICTHNSRRSHFGQVWAKTAAAYYGIKEVVTYSGGTEATAFNPNAIKAVQNVGFEVLKETEAPNPRYSVVYSPEEIGIICFSKTYDDLSNPQSGFCAVMTCTEADGNCPFIPGAAVRVSTPYDDPKAFDNTDLQEAKYDERCKQIASETLYVFSEAKKLIA